MQGPQERRPVTSLRGPTRPAWQFGPDPTPVCCNPPPLRLCRGKGAAGTSGVPMAPRAGAWLGLGYAGRPASAPRAPPTRCGGESQCGPSRRPAQSGVALFLNRAASRTGAPERGLPASAMSDSPASAAPLAASTVGPEAPSPSAACASTHFPSVPEYLAGRLLGLHQRKGYDDTAPFVPEFTSTCASTNSSRQPRRISCPLTGQIRLSWRAECSRFTSAQDFPMACARRIPSKGASPYRSGGPARRERFSRMPTKLRNY